MALPGVECLRLARCGECPLREELVKAQEWRPVPAEINDSDTLLIGQAPGLRETQLGRPFIGEFGVVVQEALNKLDVKRTDVSMTHVVACRYPKDDPKRFLGRLASRNKRRIAFPSTISHPGISLSRACAVSRLSTGVPLATGAQCLSINGWPGMPSLEAGNRQHFVRNNRPGQHEVEAFFRPLAEKRFA